MLDKIPFHPILLGIFPAVCAYTSLIDYILLEELLLPLAVSVAFTALVFGVAFLFIRDVNRASIVTSAAILLNIPFDILALALDKVTVPLGWIDDDRIYLIPYLIFAGLLIFVLARAKSEFKLLTSFLNVISLVLIISNCGLIGIHELTTQDALAKIAKHQEQIVLKKAQDSPDIYYVILDAMGRTDSLKEFYDYDNTPFIKALEKRGFVVPPHSKSNYQMTGVSIPSSLNLEYINYLADILGKDCKDHTVLFRLIQQNRLATALKGIGYKFINVRSGFSPTDYVPQADVNIGYPIGNIFHLAILRSTLAGPFLLEPISHTAREIRTFGFDHVDEILQQPSPKFVFIHLVMPHPPFLFEADGNGLTVDRISMSELYTKEKYVGHVKFVQSKIIPFVDRLARDPARKVIVMQGDHGSSIQLGADGDPSTSYLKERMRIFNAYKFADNDHSTTISDGITPVNSFRVVFNKYFDAGLPLLPDECYYSPSMYPLQLVNVTKQVTP